MLHFEATSSEDSRSRSNEQQLSFGNIDFDDTAGHPNANQQENQSIAGCSAGGGRASGGRCPPASATKDPEPAVCSAEMKTERQAQNGGAVSKRKAETETAAAPKQRRPAAGSKPASAASPGTLAAEEQRSSIQHAAMPPSRAATTSTRQQSGAAAQGSEAGATAPAEPAIDRSRQSRLTKRFTSQQPVANGKAAAHQPQPQYDRETPPPLPGLPAWLRGPLSSSSDSPTAAALRNGRSGRTDAALHADRSSTEPAGNKAHQQHKHSRPLLPSQGSSAATLQLSNGTAAELRSNSQAPQQLQSKSTRLSAAAAPFALGGSGRAETAALPGRQPSNAAKRTCKTARAMAMAADGKSLLHHELLDFAAQVAPSTAERDAVLTAVREVRAAAQSIWPQSTATLFGSQATGLALPGADLDIVVMGNHSELDKPGSGFSQEARMVLSGLLEDLLDALLQAQPPVLKGQAKIIRAAKVPIIKCQIAAGGGMPADISIGVGNGIRAVHFINRQIAALPPLRPLVLAVKAFMRERCLNEVFTGGLSSYSVTNMVMALLQQEGVARLGQAAASAEAEAADLQLASSDTSAAADLGSLLQRFFMRFGRQFSYGKQAVSVRLGGIVSKLPQWKQKGRQHILAVEDPQEKGKDIGSGSYNIRKVVDAFRCASDKLTVACASDADDNNAAAWACIQADGRSQSVAMQSLPILRSILDIELALSREEKIQRRRANWSAAKSVKIRKKGKFAVAHDSRLQQRVLDGELEVGRPKGGRTRQKKGGVAQETINSKAQHKKQKQKQKPKHKKNKKPTGEEASAAGGSSSAPKNARKQKAMRQKLRPKGGGVSKPHSA